MTTLDETRARLKDDGIEFILAQFVDIHGASKVKMVPAGELAEMAESGAGFAGGAVWGSGQGPHSHDMLARIDLDTYTPLPWLPNTARFAANLFVDGEPHPYCPRTNLIRVLDEVRSQGYEFMIGMEPEHFLVSRDACPLRRAPRPPAECLRPTRSACSQGARSAPGSSGRGPTPDRRPAPRGCR